MIVIPGALDTLRVAVDFEDFIEVPAVVTAKRTQQHQKGPETMLVEYEFKLPDGTLTAGDNVLTRLTDSPELVDRLVVREGGVDRITVFYDPTNPTRAVIHPVEAWQPLGLIGLACLLLIGGTHARFIDRRRRRLQARAKQARGRR